MHPHYKDCVQTERVKLHSFSST